MPTLLMIALLALSLAVVVKGLVWTRVYHMSLSASFVRRVTRGHTSSVAGRGGQYDVGAGETARGIWDLAVAIAVIAAIVASVAAPLETCDGVSFPPSVQLTLGPFYPPLRRESFGSDGARVVMSGSPCQRHYAVLLSVWRIFIFAMVAEMGVLLGILIVFLLQPFLACFRCLGCAPRRDAADGDREDIPLTEVA